MYDPTSTLQSISHLYTLHVIKESQIKKIWDNIPWIEGRQMKKETITAKDSDGSILIAKGCSMLKNNEGELYIIGFYKSKRCVVVNLKIENNKITGDFKEKE